MRSERIHTDIELLVVVAIIAILAALLFPLIISAKESGKRSVCTSNIMELGYNIKMHTQDWNGRMFAGNYPYNCCPYDQATSAQWTQNAATPR